MYDGVTELLYTSKAHTMAGIWRNLVIGVVLASAVVLLEPRPAHAQLSLPDSSAPAAPNPLIDPTASPGELLLFDLEARFAKDVKERGGAAFADWFAEDGVMLGNGAAPVVGKVAIARAVHWSPDVYQLLWTPTDARMSPSGDMGYTWGHYEGRTINKSGAPLVSTGRYITVWRKQPDGQWKVVLDAGANEPAATDCCKISPAE